MRYVLIVRCNGDGRDHGFRLFAHEFHRREAADAAKAFIDSGRDCESIVIEDYTRTNPNSIA